MQQPTTVSNAFSMTTRWVLIAVFTVLLLVCLWIIRGVLMLTFASIILVVLFTLPTDFLIGLGMSRGVANFISVVGIVMVVILLMLVALPTLVQQFTTLTTVTVPQGVQELIDQWENGSIQKEYPFLRDVNPREVLDQLYVQFANAAGQLGLSVLPVLGGVADTVLSILIVIFLSMYLLFDPQVRQEGVIKLFPLSYRHRAREILARLRITLRGWLKATIISMGFVGLATGLGLAALGIRQPIALGVLAGLLSFIPNFGPIFALVPSIAVGIVQTPENLGWIIVVIYGVSLIQSQIVGPLLVAESIKLPAVLVLLGQIVAGVFFGFLGLMLAVPLTAVVMVLVQEVYIKDILGDQEPHRVVEEQPATESVPVTNQPQTESSPT